MPQTLSFTCRKLTEILVCSSLKKLFQCWHAITLKSWNLYAQSCFKIGRNAPKYAFCIARNESLTLSQTGLDGSSFLARDWIVQLLIAINVGGIHGYSQAKRYEITFIWNRSLVKAWAPCRWIWRWNWSYSYRGCQQICYKVTRIRQIAIFTRTGIYRNDLYSITCRTNFQPWSICSKFSPRWMTWIIKWNTAKHSWTMSFLKNKTSSWIQQLDMTLRYSTCDDFAILVFSPVKTTFDQNKLNQWRITKPAITKILLISI